jgi:predicted 2-oxoglutarate/Fe(II)-dependent dioxygenase YbiX
MKRANGSPPGLLPGDPIPHLVLPDPAGGRIDFRHQSIAGDTVVLWLPGRVPEPAAVAAFAACAADFAAVDAQPFLIAPRPLPDDQEIPVAAALDPEDKVCPGLGVKPPCVVVVDRRGRLSSVLPGDAFAKAVQQCRTLFELSTPNVRRTGAPVLIIPEVLENDLCRELIDYWRSGDKVADRVASGSGNQREFAPIKRRIDVPISDKALFEKIKMRLAKRVVPELKRAFCFQVASFEALRIGCYNSTSGGYFKRHRDNATPFTAHRSFAMSLNLNTGEYEGGQVVFPEFCRERYEAEAGGAVIFSCNLLHEALPVSSGRRFAVFTFFADATGAALERKTIEQARAAGQQGVSLR